MSGYASEGWSMAGWYARWLVEAGGGDVGWGSGGQSSGAGGAWWGSVEGGGAGTESHWGG